MKQKRSLHNDKGNNPIRGYNPSKHYAPNTEAPKHVKQISMDIKGEINRNTVIVRDFHTPLTSMDRSSRQNQQGDSSLKQLTRSNGFN